MFEINTTGDPIIVEKLFNLLFFALFITRLNANIVSVESVAMLDQSV